MARRKPQLTDEARQRKADLCRSRAKKIDLNLLRNLVDDATLSQREIAIQIGVSLPVIERTLRKIGLKSKRGRGSPLEKNYFWSGGRWIDPDGYVMVKSPGHPYATKAGYVREHRLAMEKALGRYLLPEEVVHHRKAGEKANNDPGNLQVYRNNSEHFLAEHNDHPRDPKTGRLLPKRSATQDPDHP